MAIKSLNALHAENIFIFLLHRVRASNSVLAHSESLKQDHPPQIIRSFIGNIVSKHDNASCYIWYTWFEPPPGNLCRKDIRLFRV